MIAYLQLQFKRTNRKLTAFGLPPILAYILLPLIFVWVSVYLFTKITFAEYLYVFVVLGLLLKLTDTKRNEFLKSCYSVTGFLKLRFVENLLVVTPFALFLLYQSEFIFLVISLGLAVIFTFIRININSNFTIPTPFYKNPFEFTVGFRNTFYIFPIAYFLAYMAVSVGNFNLGVFSMLALFLVAISYYTKLENEFYIWSYNLTPKEFLLKKIKTSFYYTTLLILPLLIVLGAFFTTEFETILVFLIFGYAYLITVILAKYAAYPNEMNVPEWVIIALSLLFPPVLIAIIPYFYHQSSKRLKAILR